MEMSRFYKIFQESFLNLLEGEGYQSFIAGSKRFGYDNTNSDLDIVVYAESPLRLTGIEILLSKAGFTRESVSYTDQMSSVWRLGQILHILIMENIDEFEKLREEHLAVAEALKENPVLLKFIQELKPYLPHVKGSEVYRAILAALAGQEIEISLDDSKNKKKTINIQDMMNGDT
jgi:predicted nucleotidyltransferase